MVIEYKLSNVYLSSDSVQEGEIFFEFQLQKMQT
jgi:hypothetical protein